MFSPQVLDQILIAKYTISSWRNRIQKAAIYWIFFMLKQLREILKLLFPEILLTFILRNNHDINPLLSLLSTKNWLSLPSDICSNLVYVFSCPWCNTKYIHFEYDMTCNILWLERCMLCLFVCKFKFWNFGINSLPSTYPYATTESFIFLRKQSTWNCNIKQCICCFVNAA